MVLQFLFDWLVHAYAIMCYLLYSNLTVLQCNERTIFQLTDPMVDTFARHLPAKHLWARSLTNGQWLMLRNSKAAKVADRHVTLYSKKGPLGCPLEAS